MSKFFVVADIHKGKVKKATLEILSHARQFTNELFVIALGELGDAAEATGKMGAKKVFHFGQPELKSYSAEGYAKAIADLVKTEKATALLASTATLNKDVLPRVAAILDVAAVTDVNDFSFKENTFSIRRPVYSGKAFAMGEFKTLPAIATVRANVFPVEGTNGAAAEVVAAQATLGTIRTKVISISASQSEKADLTEASLIVSGGRAMKNSENFKILNELADVIGATVGASRAAVDSGYAPHSMQVGQTGKVVNPNLYIACGISGAIQHLAGMRTSKVIVAINKDPDAPLFQVASYGVVADLFEAVPLLTQEFKKLLAE